MSGNYGADQSFDPNRQYAYGIDPSLTSQPAYPYGLDFSAQMQMPGNLNPFAMMVPDPSATTPGAGSPFPGHSIDSVGPLPQNWNNAQLLGSLPLPFPGIQMPYEPSPTSFPYAPPLPSFQHSQHLLNENLAAPVPPSIHLQPPSDTLTQLALPGRVADVRIMDREEGEISENGMPSPALTAPGRSPAGQRLEVLAPSGPTASLQGHVQSMATQSIPSGPLGLNPQLNFQAQHPFTISQDGPSSASSTLPMLKPKRTKEESAKLHAEAVQSISVFTQAGIGFDDLIKEVGQENRALLRELFLEAGVSTRTSSEAAPNHEPKVSAPNVTLNAAAAKQTPASQIVSHRPSHGNQHLQQQRLELGSRSFEPGKAPDVSKPSQVPPRALKVPGLSTAEPLETKPQSFDQLQPQKPPPAPAQSKVSSANAAAPSTPISMEKPKPPPVKTTVTLRPAHLGSGQQPKPVGPAASTGPKQVQPASREQYLARLQAAKSKKSTSQEGREDAAGTAGAIPRSSSVPAQKEKPNGAGSKPIPPAPRKGSGSDPRKTELIRQRLEALNKLNTPPKATLQTLEKCEVVSSGGITSAVQPVKQSDQVVPATTMPRQEPSIPHSASNNAGSSTSSNLLSFNQDAIPGLTIERPPTMDQQPTANSTELPIVEKRIRSINLSPMLQNALEGRSRKRPVSSDFMVTDDKASKRVQVAPKSQADERCVIDLSDDEEEEGEVQNAPHTIPRDAQRVSLSSLIPASGAQSHISSVRSSAPQSPFTGKTPEPLSHSAILRKKEEEIAAYKKKIRDAVAKKAARELSKASDGRGVQTPRSEQQTNRSKPIPEDIETTVPQHVGPTPPPLSDALPIMSTNVEQSQPASSPTPKRKLQPNADIELKRRQQAELDASMASNQARIRQLMEEMAKLEEENRKKMEDREKLAKELENMGIDTTGMSHSDLQATKDELVQSQAANAELPESPSSDHSTETNVVPSVESNSAELSPKESKFSTSQSPIGADPEPAANETNEDETNQDDAMDMSDDEVVSSDRLSLYEALRRAESTPPGYDFSQHWPKRLPPPNPSNAQPPTAPSPSSQLGASNNATSQSEDVASPPVHLDVAEETPSNQITSESTPHAPIEDIQNSQLRKQSDVSMDLGLGSSAEEGEYESEVGAGASRTSSYHSIPQAPTAMSHQLPGLTTTVESTPEISNELSTFTASSAHKTTADQRPESALQRGPDQQNRLPIGNVFPDSGEMPSQHKQSPAFVAYESPLRMFRAYRYHPEYAKIVSGGFKSLTYSHNIDVSKPLCPFEASGGSCNDPNCQYQHFRNMELSGDKVLVQIGTANPGRTAEERKVWNDGLKGVIRDLRSEGVRDPEAVAAAIAEYRRQFLNDPSRILGI